MRPLRHVPKFRPVMTARIYIAAQRDDIDFNLAYIPESFKTLLREPFDPVYMEELFKVGYGLAVNGYLWAKTPPGYAAPEIEPPLPPSTAKVATGKRRAAGAGS
jgi:hypothetical protein